MKLIKWLALLAVLVVAGTGVGWWRVSTYLRTPLAVEAPVDFEVKQGDALRSVLQRLHERALLPRPDWLYAYARLTDRSRVLAGAYRLGTNETPRSLLTKINNGAVRTEQFTLAEGLNRWEVRDLLAADGWMQAATFDRYCDDAEFLAAHDIPGPTCEGYLYPETYTFARGVPPKRIFAELFASFSRVYRDVTAHGAQTGPLDFNKREFATLASIVEKETAAAQERPRIACVFYNRLQADPPWRLETDPTVIYAATLEDPDFDGDIKRKHLRRMDNPYNTYQTYGLPPGPIANAGRGAFAAVADPTSCEDFFFVSRNDGTHVFCPTLACHRAAVRKWQIEYFR